MTDRDDVEYANEVFLRGRLADTPALVELPSGDLMLTFRLVVARDKKSRVDSIECVALAAGVRRRLERTGAGDILEVSGQLHRRFWRSPTGPASRYSVQASAVKVSRSGRRGGAARVPKPVSV